MRRALIPVLLLQCLIILILTKGFGKDLFYSALRPYIGQVQTASGVVTSIKIKETYTALNVDMGWENILVRLKNTTDESYVYDLVGRSVHATGRITRPAGQRNPGCFDYEQYLKARKCYTIMDVSVFKFEPGKIKRPGLHILAKLKCSYIKSAKEIFDSDSFAITNGVLFGDKAYLDDEIYEDFQQNGIAHILAVSGLHVGLIYQVIRRLLKRKDFWASAISIAALFVYAALADFSVSVIRAAAMIALSIIAFHIKRRYDMLSAASLVAIIMLSINPYYLYDSGAQLSFLAAYSLAVILPFCESRFKSYCDRKKSELLYKIVTPFLPGFCLQIGMAPLMAFHFLNFSPLSIFINPLAIYLASLLLPAGLICFVIHPAAIMLAAGGAVCNVLCKLLIFLSDAAGIIGGISVPAPSFSMLAVYYLLIFYYFSESRVILLRQKKERLSAAVAAALTICACVLPCILGISQSVLPWKYNSYDAVFLDVGQGDSTHLQSGSINILIDGGGSYYKDVAKDTLRPYLLKNGVAKIDMAIVTHLDSDHSKGVADLSHIMKIKTIVFPVSAQSEDLSDFKADEIIFVSSGQEIDAGRINIKILSPSQITAGDSNESSLVCLCSINDYKIVFLGDVPKETETRIDFPKADIVKIAHHGSKSSTSSKMLTQTNPQYAIISCGLNNRYGHPHKEVTDLLCEFGIDIKRTDYDGAIKVKKGSLKTQTASE